MLVQQFMTETLLTNLLAFSVALFAVKLLLPAYFSLAGRPATGSFFTGSFWGICLALFVFNCLLSGIYPALVLSAVKPISITRKTFTGSAKGILFRKALVTGQFVAALIVVSAAVIVYKQLAFMRSQNLGMNAEEVLVVRGPSDSRGDTARRALGQAFRNSLLQLPEVQKVAVSQSLPGASLHDLSTTSRYGADKKAAGYNYYLYGIDADFISTMEIKLAAGRNFYAGSPNKNEVIISAEAARLLGFGSPAAAVGQKITWGLNGIDFCTVIGVIEDYHQQSLKQSLLPMVHGYNTRGPFYSARINTKDVQHTVAAIRKVWQDQYPGYPFEYYFLNDLFDQQYKSDQQFGKVIELFSAFTLFITCLGILGLTAYNITQRTKEIGIRKVLGASVSGIVSLLSKDFIKLVMLAIIIATPLTWYVMSQCLQVFAYRIHIPWWVFVLTGSVAVCMALLVVSLQAVKAGLANPVKSLRSE